MSIQDAFQSIAFAGARFTSFSANAIVFGLVPICLLVLRPAFATLGNEGWAEGKKRLAGRLEDVLQACLVASATATLIGIVLQVAILAGIEGDITTGSFTSLAGTPFGRAYLVRLPLLAGLAVLLVGRVRDRALAGAGDDEPAPKPAWWTSWVLLSAGLLATSSFSGHAAVGNPRTLSIGNDIVHLLSGAAWFAGIVILAAILPLAWRKKDDSERRRLITPVVVRFSKLALVAITVVAITGVINSLFDVAHLSDMVEDGYGIALSIKIIFFLGVLALGGLNHFYVRRRLEKGEDDRNVVMLFRKAIATELALGLIIMGTTGVLTGLAKTRESTVTASSTSRASATPE